LSIKLGLKNLRRSEIGRVEKLLHFHLGLIKMRKVTDFDHVSQA
jgi:hypothetical protein